MAAGETLADAASEITVRVLHSHEEFQETLALCQALQPRLRLDTARATLVAEMLLAMAPHVWTHVRQIGQQRLTLEAMQVPGEQP